MTVSSLNLSGISPYIFFVVEHLPTKVVSHIIWLCCRAQYLSLQKASGKNYLLPWYEGIVPLQLFAFLKETAIKHGNIFVLELMVNHFDGTTISK